jgi:carboxylesterase
VAVSVAERHPVMPGCEPISHVAGSRSGVLVVHGFTGTPFSVRGVADAMIAAGHHVEAPRLPGHGTHVDDLLSCGWSDWSAEVVRAHRLLRERADRVVAVGQSMGATLALWLALGEPGVDGLVCINPVTRPRSAEELDLIDGLIEDGLAVVPGEGSDIADPDGFDIAYDGTPLRPIRSFLRDGVAPISDRFGELTVPLRLFTSRQDHVVAPGDSEHLAGAHGGPVEHTWLERSYHVVTRDLDRACVEAAAVEFVDEVVA